MIPPLSDSPSSLILIVLAANDIPLIATPFVVETRSEPGPWFVKLELAVAAMEQLLLLPVFKLPVFKLPVLQLLLQLLLLLLPASK